MSNQEINVFAKTNFRNRDVRFGIKKDDRRRHTYIIGKTGMGKTTMIENMVLQDIYAGHGIAFVDPHGEAVEKIINFIPPNRINDVVYFNPADLEFPIAFNPLEAVDTKYKHLVASGLMGVFTKIWENVWSARMEYILNNTILALLDTPGNTMLGIARMLVDKKFRKKIIDNTRDPVVKSFWIDEFANYNERFRNEAIAPIQNKVGQFLSSSIIRNIVGQPKSTIDLRDIMDNNKILLLNLSKGRIGEDNSALLGAMFITKLQLAAMSRVDITEEERSDFYLYVDEFQNFATESFATILSEARKYRLNLTIAHQYIEQLDEKVEAAVFGNVGTIIAFRVGATDAESLEVEFQPYVDQTDLVNLSKFCIYLKLMINGVASKPFSAITLPPIAEKTNSAEKVINVSRERYGRQRVAIEEKITRWLGQEYHMSASEQNLTEEDEENAQGGAIFTKKNDLPENKPAQPKPPHYQRPSNASQKNTQQIKPRSQPAKITKSEKNHSEQQTRIKPQQAKVPQTKPTSNNPIWEEVAKATEQKIESKLKQATKGLYFDFSDDNSGGGTNNNEDGKSPQPANLSPQTEAQPNKQQNSEDKNNFPQKPLKPGEVAKF